MGDLFDAWLGDDQRLKEPFAHAVLQSMRTISAAGPALYLARGWIAFGLRRKSRTETARKPESILDVNPRAVEDAFRAHGVTRIVHGHTHRPARHESIVDGRACERIVLADWDDRGHYVAIDRGGVRAYDIAA